MSAISIGGGNHGAAIARVAADWLGLAAAPAFATMALMTVCLGGGVEPLCSHRAWLAHERNGPDVSAHERVSCGPMAEADCRLEKLTLSFPRKRESSPSHPRSTLLPGFPIGRCAAVGNDSRDDQGHTPSSQVKSVSSHGDSTWTRKPEGVRASRPRRPKTSTAAEGEPEARSAEVACMSACGCVGA